MATEQGVVIKTSLHSAWVKTVRSTACESCAAKSSCDSLGGANEREVEVINEAGARVGDLILLSLETASLLRATFLLYLLPILLLVAGAVVGQKVAPLLGFNASAFSAAVGFGFFFVTIALVRLKANRLAKKTAYRPKIVRILKPSQDLDGPA